MFYKEANFSNTEVGKIPKEWKYGKLIDFSMTKDSPVQTGPFGAQLHASDYTDEGVPLILIKNVLDGQIIEEDMPLISETKASELERYRLKAGDIVFSRVGSVGRAAVIRSHQEGWLVSGQMLRVRLENPQIDNDFLSYAIASHWFQRALASRTVGATRKSINTEILSNLPMVAPPLPEQQKIVEIFFTTDEAIQKTDEVIAKIERLKKGLMHELLTKGIGHKEFKDTEMGRIPETWVVVRLKDVVEINKESRDPLKELPDKTFLYVDIDSVEGGSGKIRNPKRILGKDAPSRARRVIHENDVIMSTVRPYLKAFAIVPGEYENQICSTGFAVLSCGDDVLPYFLLNVLFSSQVITQCNRMMVGGQYPALNQSQVSKIKIPLPPLFEQQKIANIFSTVDRNLELERNEKERLERIKHGLLTLFLTGIVRVRVAQI